MTKQFTVKVLEVTAQELDEKGSQYTFEALELENGVILIPGESTNDWFFENRDSIEPSGTATTVSVEDSGETRIWTVKELKTSIEGSISEFGEDEATAKALELLNA